MDRAFSIAMRGIRSSGQMVEMVVEMIKEMSNSDRRMVDNWLRFYREREQRHWSLGVGYNHKSSSSKTYLILPSLG